MLLMVPRGHCSFSFRSQSTSPNSSAASSTHEPQSSSSTAVTMSGPTQSRAQIRADEIARMRQALAEVRKNGAKLTQSPPRQNGHQQQQQTQDDMTLTISSITANGSESTESDSSTADMNRLVHQMKKLIHVAELSQTIDEDQAQAVLHNLNQNGNGNGIGNGQEHYEYPTPAPSQPQPPHQQHHQQAQPRHISNHHASPARSNMFNFDPNHPYPSIESIDSALQVVLAHRAEQILALQNEFQLDSQPNADHSEILRSAQPDTLRTPPPHQLHQHHHQHHQLPHSSHHQPQYDFSLQPYQSQPDDVDASAFLSPDPSRRSFLSSPSIATTAPQSAMSSRSAFSPASASDHSTEALIRHRSVFHAQDAIIAPNLVQEQQEEIARLTEEVAHVQAQKQILEERIVALTDIFVRQSGFGEEEEQEQQQPQAVEPPPPSEEKDDSTISPGEPPVSHLDEAVLSSTLSRLEASEASLEAAYAMLGTMRTELIEKETKLDELKAQAAMLQTKMEYEQRAKDQLQQVQTIHEQQIQAERELRLQAEQATAQSQEQATSASAARDQAEAAADQAKKEVDQEREVRWQVEQDAKRRQEEAQRLEVSLRQQLEEAEKKLQLQQAQLLAATAAKESTSSTSASAPTPSEDVLHLLRLEKERYAELEKLVLFHDQQSQILGQQIEQGEEIRLQLVTQLEEAGVAIEELERQVEKHKQDQQQATQQIKQLKEEIQTLKQHLQQLASDAAKSAAAAANEAATRAASASNKEEENKDEYDTAIAQAHQDGFSAGYEQACQETETIMNDWKAKQIEESQALIEVEKQTSYSSGFEKGYEEGCGLQQEQMTQLRDQMKTAERAAYEEGFREGKLEAAEHQQSSPANMNSSFIRSSSTTNSPSIVPASGCGLADTSFGSNRSGVVSSSELSRVSAHLDHLTQQLAQSEARIEYLTNELSRRQSLLNPSNSKDSLTASQLMQLKTARDALDLMRSSWLTAQDQLNQARQVHAESEAEWKAKEANWLAEKQELQATIRTKNELLVKLAQERSNQPSTSDAFVSPDDQEELGYLQQHIHHLQTSLTSAEVSDERSMPWRNGRPPKPSPLT